jgi:hypothetical protein
MDTPDTDLRRQLASGYPATLFQSIPPGVKHKKYGLRASCLLNMTFSEYQTLARLKSDFP